MVAREDTISWGILYFNFFFQQKKIERKNFEKKKVEMFTKVKIQNIFRCKFL